MTNQEKLDAFQARIDKFIISNKASDGRAWHRSGIAKTYMLLCDQLTGDDLTSLHGIALSAVPQLDPQFGARLTAINER